MGKIYINGGNDSVLEYDVIAKEDEYLDYINNHVANAITAFNNLFNNKVYNLEGITDDPKKFANAVEIVSHDIEIHDATKYSDDEFYAYRRKFYPTLEEQNIKDQDEIDRVNDNYNKAWKHHYTHNYHHPLFWKYVDQNGKILDTPLEIARPMPLYAIIHMICDWEAMSMRFNGDTVEWYNTKATTEKSDMNPETKIKVENLLRVIYNKEIQR